MNRNIIITGTSKGIGKYLSEYYLKRGDNIFGCSRSSTEIRGKNYKHFNLDVSNESQVKSMFSKIRKSHGNVDILINNAGIASMNHSLLTKIDTVHKIFNTNVVGTFLFCREAAKLMHKNKYGRIVNFTTVAVPLNLEGESIYASSKAAINSITKILSKELAHYGITVNSVGPTPTKTDLIKSVPKNKINDLINNQAIKRLGTLKDISNIIDFFIDEKSDFITGQTLYLGGI